MSRGQSVSMALTSPPIAHLILGRRFEPYLEAALESIGGCCGHLVVNDNSGVASSPHAAVLGASPFGQAGRITVARSGFVDFSSARNACIAATPKEYSGAWVLFFDADEVHGGELGAIAELLPRLPADVRAVDGYSRHFVGSYRWCHSVQRRLCFFRLAPDLRWSGAVHERLAPLGRRVVLPAVWSHYGHVVTPRMEAEKGRLYGALGQSGPTALEADLPLLDARVWAGMLVQALPFHGYYETAVLPTIAKLSTAWASTFAQVDALAAKRPVRARLRAALGGINSARIIAYRRLEARLRWGWQR
ncbi:MAG: glycosyltransferase family 2 protein [Candidatus Eremiobacteraeota bacterium]|nr:glycosyltransferase family 2 protein [Candidatus Eremiobacteraeota bacterium]